MLESRGQGKEFCCKENEIRGDWRSFMVIILNKIIGLSKSRWAGYVACKGEFLNLYGVLARKETYGRPSGKRETVLKIIL